MNGLDVLVKTDHKFLTAPQVSSLGLDILEDLADRHLVLNTKVLVDENLMLVTPELVVDGANAADGLGDVFACAAGLHGVERLNSGILRADVLNALVDDVLGGLALQNGGDILLAVVGGAANVQEQSRDGLVEGLGDELLHGNIVEVQSA